MLFVRRLPQDLSRKALRVLIQGAIRDPGRHAFSMRASVCGCSILRITDSASGDSEVHGLVEVQPAKAAMRVIEALNGKQLQGSELEVRRYHHRSSLRERRQKTSVGRADNHRQGDRRRKNLKIELVSW